jgi:endonuclease/exonuclease/phosphatase family metal-dependent hydrolase
MLRLFVVFIALMLTSPGLSAGTLRVATFNIAMGLEEAGLLARALQSGEDARLGQVAGVLQRTRPDIVLLNEFDYDPSVDTAGLLNANYLARGQEGRQAITYPYHYRAPVNTGVDSGLDLDGDGRNGGPGDSWGFGHFPGQYGMLVLSRYPLASSRSFREFRWSDMPGALRPEKPDGSSFHPDETWEQLRLSSKSHWDLAFDVGGRRLHLLVHHPTPPVFDGPEDRNGRRNFDEIRFWLDYITPGDDGYTVDDQGLAGGITAGAPFVIAGDFNADPYDGDSLAGAIGQLLQSPRVNARCNPVSKGAAEAARAQGGVTGTQSGDPAADTADFDDRHTGNLRLDYVLPSSELAIMGCGVFWPAANEPGHALAGASDHHLVWVDIEW